ncbi:MAG: hypothetical protein GXP52_03365 [Deltaproteobacteria bacterium]|nr:hypothetical protein [Deltaproteobacteria bacterium]
MKHTSKIEPLPSRWDDFLKALLNRLATPSPPSLPSVRCLSAYTLSRMFTEIQKEQALPTTFPSGVKILNHLKAMGLASRVPIEGISKRVPSKDFYLIGIHASHDVDADPLELLQAYKQEGVICYFSALFYFNLTTQIPTHHHIATILKQKRRPRSEMTTVTFEQPSSDNSGKREKLGTRAFSYQDVPIYLTKRQENTIPGIKLRVFNPRTQIRMTTIEQTLLDTFQYPYKCGGPEVIFESWNAHINKINESLILEYLKKIDILSLTRRVGAMFDVMAYKPDPDLARFLEGTRRETLNITGIADIPLFRGTHYLRINQNWRILIP